MGEKLRRGSKKPKSIEEITAELNALNEMSDDELAEKLNKEKSKMTKKEKKQALKLLGLEEEI